MAIENVPCANGAIELFKVLMRHCSMMLSRDI